MAVSNYCYYVDSNMIDDVFYAIKVHRLPLHDDGNIGEVQSQWVKINRMLSKNIMWLGGSVQPTSTGLLLISGQLDGDAGSSCPIGFAQRNTQSGEIVSNFLPFNHSVRDCFRFCSHCLFYSGDNREQVFIVGGVLKSGEAHYRIYRVVLQNGRPVQIHFEGESPHDPITEKHGNICFVQDNRLWVLGKSENGVRAFNIPLNNDGSVNLVAGWKLAGEFRNDRILNSLNHSQSYAFSPDGGRFWMSCYGGGYNYILEATIRGDEVIRWAVGYLSAHRKFCHSTGILIFNEQYLYTLALLYPEGWFWLRGKKPDIGIFCGSDSYWFRYSYWANKYIKVDGVTYFPIFRGGVTYAAPPNSAPNFSGSITIDEAYKDKVLRRLSIQGSVSGSNNLWYIFNNSYIGSNISVSNGRWLLPNLQFREGGYGIGVIAFDEYNGFGSDTMYCYLDRQPPRIEMSPSKEKSLVVTATVTDWMSGVSRIDWAYSENYTNNPSYITIFDRGFDKKCLINRVNVCVKAPESTVSPIYNYFRVYDNAGWGAVLTIFSNVTPSGYVPPPSGNDGLNQKFGFIIYKTPDRFHDVKDPVDARLFPPHINPSMKAYKDYPHDLVDNRSPIFFEIWWNYPPPDGGYKEVEGDFVRYDFDGDGSISLGEECGYICYLYYRWEYLTKEQPDSNETVFKPATPWLPYKNNPITARGENGEWVRTSVLSLGLTVGVDIFEPPTVWVKRSLVSRYVPDKYDQDYWDEPMVPNVWRLALAVSCNKPAAYASTGAYYFVGY